MTPALGAAMARPAVLPIEPTNERPARQPPKPVATVAPVAPVPRRVAEVIIPTVREYLPWHLLERRLAERASGIAKRAAPVTDDVNTLTDVDVDAGAAGESGVSISERWATSDEDDVPPKSGVSRTADADLSYQVYSVDDLARRREAKQREAWLKKRETPPQFPVMSRPWALALARNIDWRRTAKKAGLVAGACSLFGFGMLTAAELTDDVRPSTRASVGATGVEPTLPRGPVGKADVVTIPAAVSVRTIVFVPVPPSAPVAIPSVESAFEEPTPSKAPQRVTKVAAKPKADVEVFIP